MCYGNPLRRTFYVLSPSQSQTQEIYNLLFFSFYNNPGTDWITVVTLQNLAEHLYRSLLRVYKDYYSKMPIRTFLKLSRSSYHRLEWVTWDEVVVKLNFRLSKLRPSGVTGKGYPKPNWHDKGQTLRRNQIFFQFYSFFEFPIPSERI